MRVLSFKEKHDEIEEAKRKAEEALRGEKFDALCKLLKEGRLILIEPGGTPYGKCILDAVGLQEVRFTPFGTRTQESTPMDLVMKISIEDGEEGGKE